MRRRAGIVVACAVLAAPSAGQSNALPERDTFLRETREALARSQELWHRYAYKERRTEIHLNPFGRMGMGGTRITEVRPSADPRLTYRRIIERNGAPVPALELARQDAEYRERVAQLKRESADANDEKRRQQDEQLARRRAQMVVDDVVNTLQFDIVRREFRDGRRAIVIAFSGRPTARPSTREGRLAKVFAGHVWVDERTREVVYLEGVARDDVSFGGFIAKVYEGTKAVVVRRPIEAGVWMPTRLTLTGDVRALFRRAKIDHAIEWFDYRIAPD
ncbi:MAG TPA: hypothetical protein VJ691_00895 [Vicinamibacterales bacterium]|nr:hypothetical protein [Vicinamibacterales bacterium]